MNHSATSGGIKMLLAATPFMLSACAPANPWPDVFASIPAYQCEMEKKCDLTR